MTNLVKNTETNKKNLSIKTIDIQAKEWFDRINGNSYFAGIITVDFGMPTEKQFKMPFQYGYGSQYEQEAFTILRQNNLLPDKVNGYTPNLKDFGIVVRSNIQKNCKKQELKNI